MNMTFNNIPDKEFGEIKVIKNNRSKYIRITIHPFEGVKVTAPYSMSNQNLYHFIQSKKNWITTKLDKIKQLENIYTVFNDDSNFQTREHTLKISKQKSKVIKLIIKNGVIHVIYPDDADISDKKIQNAIRKAVEEAWRIEAKRFIPARVSDLAYKYNFKYKKVFIKNLRSIWGSCSAKNNVNFNLHLMRLPLYLIDHVILHELCHTLQKNHGKGFKMLLEKVSPNWKKYEAEMKNYRTYIW